MANKKVIPAISVIIPMYNVEKYIGECLDSILAQTFGDFEVIVVDDCSTDKSREVVESYIPKFSGRLQLVKSEKNSGGCVGQPRNVAINLSRGKYLFFMDSDDAIVDNMFEELYAVAEKFQADVVHCEKYYQAPGETAITDKKFLNPHSDEQVEFVKEPTVVTDSLGKRIKDFGERRYIGYPWNRLISRQLIAENDIRFPLVRCGDDHIFSLYVLCVAKKIVRVPTPYYVWRKRTDSVTWEQLPVDKLFHRWCDSLFRGAQQIDEFMDRFEFFRNNPTCKYWVFESLAQLHTSKTIPAYSKISAPSLDGIVRRELEQVEDKTALTAFLFGRMNFFISNSLKQNQLVQNQQNVIKQLADGIKMMDHNEQVKIFLREKFFNLIQKYSSIPADKKFEKVSRENYRLYFCWLGGEETLPPVVQCCYNSLKTNAGDYKICFIDEKNFSDYVELPDYILKKFREGKISPAHFSDIIRVNLLEKYGGLWIDATILVTEPLEKHQELFDLLFYTQKICQTKDMQNEFMKNSNCYVSYARWATFLLGSSILHNPLFVFAKDFYNEYWKEFDGVVDYFLMDYMIDIAYEKIPFVKAEMDAVPINNPEIHTLVNRLVEKYSDYPYEKILKDTFLHKLTYKFPFDYQDKQTVLYEIMQKYR